MKKKQAKFIQIMTNSNFTLYALDDAGQVWRLSNEREKWEKLISERQEY